MLSHRYTELLQSNTPNQLKKHMSLLVEKGDRSWKLEEDMLLLRGYGVYGDKWPLISMFYLPQRNRKEVQIR
jgi:hypothetical protein